MHFEILVEDRSGHVLLETLLPELLGTHGDPHTWNIHGYKGIGRIPPGLAAVGDPVNRILLDQLPRILRGYSKTPGIDAVVVVMDTDTRDCREFLDELRELAKGCNMLDRTLFRLAIEEMEAWYLGDRNAIIEAYPRAKKGILDSYVQDSVCGTWELLADAVYPGGSTEIKRVGWPLPGQVKREWAEEIGLYMNVDDNASPSFGKFRDGIRRLVATESEGR
jgi:hypothetical protein